MKDKSEVDIIAFHLYSDHKNKKRAHRKSWGSLIVVGRRRTEKTGAAGHRLITTVISNPGTKFVRMLP